MLKYAENTTAPSIGTIGQAFQLKRNFICSFVVGFQLQIQLSNYAPVRHTQIAFSAPKKNFFLVISNSKSAAGIYS